MSRISLYLIFIFIILNFSCSKNNFSSKIFDEWQSNIEDKYNVILNNEYDLEYVEEMDYMNKEIDYELLNSSLITYSPNKHYAFDIWDIDIDNCIWIKSVFHKK